MFTPRYVKHSKLLLRHAQKYLRYVLHGQRHVAARVNDDGDHDLGGTRGGRDGEKNGGNTQQETGETMHVRRAATTTNEGPAPRTPAIASAWRCATFIPLLLDAAVAAGFFVLIIWRPDWSAG